MPESSPLSRRREAREPLPPQLEREASVYLQLLASRQTFLSVGKPACQQAALLCLAGQSRHSAKGRKIQQSGGWWQTSCYSPRLWLNITIDLNKLRQEASANKLKGQWLPFIVFKITIDCLFKFGGSGLVLASGSQSRSEKLKKKEEWKIELRMRIEGRSWVHKNQIAPLPLHCYKGTMLPHAKR